MAWSYDEGNLNTDDTLGRLNAVRLLIGDTDTNDQQVQDEEIVFGLAQANNNVYSAGAWVCRTIAAKYSRNVDSEISGALKESASQLQDHYNSLADNLEYQGSKLGGLGIAAGGIRVSTVDGIRANTNRVKPEFNKDQFKIDTQNYNYE
ncbi:hypothetical protein CRP6_gp50 [Roseobacter phage CRP-6]|jgi:hypothetical protein|nr:hypothetical protein CRP6_gp50 [Roseobacter phage CRP-6]